MRLDTLDRAGDVAPARPGTAGRLPLLPALTVVAVAAGLVLRFASVSELWLDEALSVNIARLPLRDLPDALRRDGAPPLYYVLLHGWMALVGEGNAALRALSGVLSVAALPLAWLAGRRLGGDRVAWAALLLLATSPFAIRYATEVRMYALVQLLVLAKWLAVQRALERPTGPRLAPVAVVAGLLALTHYWSLYLLAATAGALAVAAVRSPARRRAALRTLAGLALGGVLFLPWVGVFLHQLAHTGTPWGVPALPLDAAFTTLNDFGGGPWAESRLLGLALAGLAAVALLGRPAGPLRLELDLRTLPGARIEAALAAATFVLAIAASYAGGNAFASRYTSVLFPLVLLVAAVGVRVFDRRALAAVLGIVALLGLGGGVRNAVDERTQAGEVAATILAGARPGDVVAACPDQLAVAAGRLLPPALAPRAFPDLDRSGLVDWVDYEERNEADPDAFARRLLDLAGRDNAVWLVWAPGYRTLEDRCERVSGALAALRPGTRIVLDREPRFFEGSYVTHAPARTR